MARDCRFASQVPTLFGFVLCSFSFFFFYPTVPTMGSELLGVLFPEDAYLEQTR